MSLIWPNGSTSEPACTDVYAMRDWSAPGVRAFHTGDDTIGFDELYAIGAGTVIESSYIGWAGWQVLVYLGEIGGVRTWVRYCHLKERSHLSRGDTVRAGDLIGRMGMTGISFGVHLHWEIYRGHVDRGGGTGPQDVGSTIDPREFVRAHLGTTPATGQKEEDEMPDSMYAVVDGVPSWCWLNWATGKLYAVHSQAEADWVAAYMGSVKMNLAKAIHNGQHVTDGGSGLYKSKLALFGMLAPSPHVVNAGELSDTDLKRIREQLDAGLAGLALKATA